jgi:hypothetical protein
MVERIVAVALLNRTELQGLGAAFDRAWPIQEAPCFSGLLQAIDEADREYWRERGANHLDDMGQRLAKGFDDVGLTER